jgi:hypothetical protein
MIHRDQILLAIHFAWTRDWRASKEKSLVFRLSAPAVNNEISLPSRAPFFRARLIGTDFDFFPLNFSSPSHAAYAGARAAILINYYYII